MKDNLRKDFISIECNSDCSFSLPIKKNLLEFMVTFKKSNYVTCNMKRIPYFMYFDFIPINKNNHQLPRYNHTIPIEKINSKGKPLDHERVVSYKKLISSMLKSMEYDNMDVSFFFFFF
jgi:hypothetical protein